MKKILSLIFATFSVANFAQTNVATARASALGSVVFYKGVSLNGPELGTIRYIQDATGGLAVYGTGLTNVLRGDSVHITGTLTDYNGLLEVTPATIVAEQGVVTNPTPYNLVIPQLGEAYESQLVRITNVTFAATGNFAVNTNYNFTDGTNTGVIRITGSTNPLIGTAIPTGPRTITGPLSQFTTIYQIIPRDAADIAAYVAPAREITVNQATTFINTGDQFAVGGVGVDPFTISNSGTGNLTISNATLSGANAAEFTTDFSALYLIAGGGNSTLNVTFAPTGTGTRTATLTIANDDSDESPFVINLIGYGTDNLATEPTAQATALIFPNVKAYTITGSFTPTASATNYVVVWKKTVGALTGVPVDGTTYRRGDIVGNGFVAYVGPNSNFVPRGIVANQTSQYAVYGFNGTTGFENYYTTTALTGSITSTGSATGAYYGTITGTNATLISDLTTLINPHTVISYVNYKNTVMQNFELLDTTQGRSLVVCAYSGERKIVTDPFDWTIAGYSREHSYCHSWMPSFPADSPAKPEYSDQHNLYPTNLAQANSPRSNYALGEVVSGITQSYLEGKLGNNANGQLVYEPRESQKGNAARSIFYMAVAYNTIGGLNWSLPDGSPNPIQDQTLLKTWHSQDPVDNYEIARHEYMYNQQGNRNPFIDSIDFVCHINFANMTYIADCSGTGSIEEKVINERSLVVYPNPVSDEVYIQVYDTKVENITILDAMGKEIMNTNYESLPQVKLDATKFAAGIYVARVQTPVGTFSRQFSVK
jgi:endonuclease I